MHSSSLLRFSLALLLLTPMAAAANPAVASDCAMPFPQHVQYAQGIVLPLDDPSQMDGQVQRLYLEWKAKYLRANPYDDQQTYVHWDGEEGITVSEGHGYGMLILAYMAGFDAEARTLFDGMVRYYLAHPSAINPALMAWQQDDDGTRIVDINGVDSATDGDLDIAYALLLADRQWGSGGEFDYRDLARKSIQATMDSVVNQKSWILLIGDWALTSQKYLTRPSDFMLHTFTEFERVLGDGRYQTLSDHIVEAVRELVQNESPESGLLPDFARMVSGHWKPREPVYSWDACRVPWRLATSRIVDGDMRLSGELQTLTDWMLSATGGKPERFRCGYGLDGQPTVTYLDPAYSAPFMVAAMTRPDQRQFLTDLWSWNMNQSTASGGYYDNSIRLLCALVASGNWWSPSH